MIQDKEAISKKNSLQFFSIFIILGFMVFVLASFQLHPSAPLTGINEDVTYTYNFSLNFTGTNTNITQVNVTLPSGFSLDAPANFSQYVSTFTSSSTVLSWTNSSYWFMNGSMNNVSQWFAFNATSINPGNYNLTVAVLNVSNAGANNVSYFNISVSINDTTAPDVGVSNFTTLVSNGNYSGVITLNISILDNLQGGVPATKVFLNITNATADVQQNITTLTNTTASAWNFSSFDTNSLGDGLYNVTIWANDSNNNLNNSAYLTIRVDNTAPSGTISCTPATVQTGNTVTCTCSPTDAGSGINSGFTVYTTNPSTENTGTFTQTCSFQDNSGNSASIVSNQYTVELSSSAGVSPGTSSSTSTTASVTKTTTVDIVPGTAKVITTLDGDTGVKEISIEVSSVANNVKVDVNKYDSRPAEVSVSKSNAYRYLKVETQNLENKLSKATMKVHVEKSWVDSQGVDKGDVAIFKYDESSNVWNELSTNYDSEDDSYYYYTADLTSFSYFSIALKEEAKVEEQPQTPEESTSNFIWLWIVIGVAVIIAIISAIIVLSKPKKKK